MHAYYNDSDPFCAQWLKNLIAAGAIPGGYVDERSIADVEPDDLRGYRQCHFFAGIGGWAYALRLAGWGDRPVWTASLPCQPYSIAGQRRGAADERDLWPVFFRLVEQCRPAIIFGEQVASSIVAGSAKEMQGVRRRKALKRLQETQQGRVTWDLPGLREHERARGEALAIRAQAGLPAGETAHASWVRFDERGEAQILGEGHPIRSGVAEYSGADRSRVMRSNGHAVQLGRAESVERPIAGSDQAGSGIHEGEHPSRSLRAEHDGEQLGFRDHPQGRGCDPGETVRECVERLISQNIREAASDITWLDRIRADLADTGYAFRACIIPACAVNAPHLRQRLFWVADAPERRGWRDSGTLGSERCSAISGLGNAESKQMGRARQPWQDSTWIICLDGKARRISPQPGDEPLASGVSARVGRLRAYGNAIVAPLAALFIEAVMAAMPG